MTGIEVAGLVLGLFPIVIEGLSFYCCSASTFKEMKRHKRTLAAFTREIDLEKCNFDNTMYALASLARVDVKLLGGPPWDAAVEAALVSCLPPHSIASFVNGCQALSNILEVLAQKFQKYEQDQAGYLKMFRVLRDFTKSERNAQLESIHRLNFNLDKLVNGSIPRVSIAPTQQKSSKVNITAHYNRVRKHAIVLSSLLREKLQLSQTCICKVPLKTANLQLEVRFYGAQESGTDGDQGTDTPPRFNLVFPITVEEKDADEVTQWRELEMEHLEYSAEAPLVCTPTCKMQSCPNPTLAMDVMGEVSIETHASVLSSTVHIQEPPAKDLQGGQKKSKLPTLGTTTAVVKKVSKKLGFWLNIQKKPILRPHGTSRSRSTSPMHMPVRMSECEFTPPNSKQAMELPEVCPAGDAICTDKSPVLSDSVIPCLCSSIRNTPEPYTCLGVLISSDNKKHRVWVPVPRQSGPTPSSARTLSLADLLSFRAPSRKERLKLGVMLASSVMQLYKTEWLPEKWSKQDIYFIQQDCSQSKPPSLAYPLLYPSFTSQSSVPGVSGTGASVHEDIEALVIRCNRSLFSLGIVLLELWFWKSLESYQAEDVSYQGSHMTKHMLEYCTATRVLEDMLYDDAGDIYGDIVRRCIIGLDRRQNQLEEDAFKDEVYLKIIQPLEEYLKIFCDQESLAKIFQKQVAIGQDIY